MVNMTPIEAYEKCKKQDKRILELEDLIATDPERSYRYATDVIQGHWERGENTISKNSYYSYYYAHDVIKGSFEKCHSIIFNSDYKDDYINFLKSINYDMTKISEWLL